MDPNQRDQLFQRALLAYRRGALKSAARDFCLLVRDGSRDPRHVSYCGLLLAKAEGNVREALILCEQAVRQGFYDPEMYLNLAEIQLQRRSRVRAMEALRRGIRIHSGDKTLLNQLDRINPRAAPPLAFLSRRHPLNRYLGLTLTRLSRFLEK
ncbi:MAG: tetratricopeptide repeat protein [Vicinamibacteria bacterium]